MSVMMKDRPRTYSQRVARDNPFAKRLDTACDANAHCPAMHHGRLTWIQRELQSRYDVSVSVETVRKWCAGESQPRPDKTAMLAEILQVDVAWLQLGIDPDIPVRERKVRNAVADGAVNLIAGLIRMDGGQPAFPNDGGTVDLHAIIQGAKYDFHIATADATGKFHIPVDHDKAIVLGIERGDGFRVAIYELTTGIIDTYGKWNGGSIEVEVPREMLRRIESFGDRI